MQEVNLRKMLELCKEACTTLDVYGANTGGISLWDSCRLDLLRFAIFLGQADGAIDEEEVAITNTLLGYHLTVEDWRKRQNQEIINESYLSKVPVVLKHFVVADAKRISTSDECFNQRGQILSDTYLLFGQAICASHLNISKNEVSRLTRYVNKIEDFLVEYAVSYKGSAKAYRPKYDEKYEETQKEEAVKNKEEQTEELEKHLAKLNALTGLKEVKETVGSLINLIRVQKLREERGLKNSPIGKHLVFLGNPGTGKTTVARLIADIYRCLGVLSKGQLIETDRSGLVVGYVGQTAVRVQETVERALGGILFIDEAYSLVVNKGDNDFGQEAVDTLLKAMEDNRDNLVVIVAGYPDLMQEFLDSNPGLRSRFNQNIYFADYEPEDLLCILKGMCESKEYKLSEEAEKYCKEYFIKLIDKKNKNFANAREVRNLVEKAIANQASRIVNCEKIDTMMLTVLKREDFEDEEEKSTVL